MFKDKIVLITGATGGIGARLVTSFAQEGAIVIINYLHNETKAFELLNDINHKGMMIKADVRSEEEVKEMIAKVIKKYQKIDILINNAGIARDSLVEDKSAVVFNEVLETNLTGPFLVAKEAVKYMDNNASIINVGSTNGIDTNYPYSIDYDSSKAGLITLTKNMAINYAPIRVNCVCPGWVDTLMNRNMDPEFKEKEIKKICLKRFAKPEEISNVILFLASSKASYINGSVIRVDGGVDTN